MVWLGTATGMEARLVPQHGYEMAWVKFSGVRGKGLLRMAMLPLQAAARLLAERARRSSGTGPTWCWAWAAIIAFPGGMMAALLGKPLVIHEQNSVAGLTNRVLACLADRVLVAFPGAFNSASDKPLAMRQGGN